MFRDTYYGIRYFPHNLWRTWKLVRTYWGTHDFDWTSIAILMRYQIKRVRETILDEDIVDFTKDAQRMLIAEHCLDRMIDGDYYDIADKRHPERDESWAKMIGELEDADVEMLCKQLRYLRHWWD